MRKIILMFTLSLLILSLSAIDRPFFPKISLIEVCASSQNESVEMNTGLNVVNSDYRHDQAIVLKYYTSNSSLGNTDAQGMINTLGATVFPSAYMNGALKVKGTKPQLTSGNIFKALIQKEYFDPAGLYIYSVNLNTTTGAITGIIQDATDNSALQNLSIQYILVEDNVSNMNNVVRKVVTEPFSITADGGVFTINKTLAIDGSWNTANLKAIVVVRNTQNVVLQAGSSQPVIPQRLRFVAPHTRFAKVPINSTKDFDYVTIFSSDYSANYVLDITVSVNEYNKPEDWFISYCGHQNCYLGPSNHPLTAGDTISFHPTVQAYSAGSANLYLKVQVEGIPDITVPFNLITSTADVLLLDDDGTKNTENIYYEAMPNTGLKCAVADLSLYKLDGFDFTGYQNVIWSANNPWTFVPNSILPALQTHVNEGANLLINGANVGWTFTNENSTFKTAETVNFYNNLLSASNPVNITTAPVLVQGQNNSVGYDLSFELLNGTMNFAQLNPEYFTVTDNQAIIAFKNTTNAMGIQRHSQFGNVAYYSFGIEGIDDALIRQKIINRTLTYFGNTVEADDHTQTQKPQLMIKSYPNPFSNQANVEIQSKSADARVKAEVFNIKGQRVYETSLQLNNGKSAFSWNGKDQNQKDTPNGIYFIRINDQSQTKTSKLIRIK